MGWEVSFFYNVSVTVWHSVRDTKDWHAQGTAKEMSSANDWRVKHVLVSLRTLQSHALPTIALHRLWPTAPDCFGASTECCSKTCAGDRSYDSGVDAGRKC